MSKAPTCPDCQVQMELMDTRSSGVMYRCPRCPTITTKRK